MSVGQVLHDRYEVVRALGRGGAGELWLVRDRRHDLEHCALKVLAPRAPDPHLTPLFRREFLLLSEIRHPGIVAVRDFGVLDAGKPFFTMDYVPGENCRSFVEQDRLEPQEFVDLAAGLLASLAHVHARGVLHRDVKPENVIMQRGDGRLLPCLVDFGLAVLSAARRSGEAAGTLPYVAPEVLAGGAPDQRSDLFSLGMLLFEVGTGEAIAPRGELLRAPGRMLAPDRIRRQFNKSARDSAPPRIEEIIGRLVAPTPAQRFPSAAAAQQALRDLYGDDAVGARLDLAVRPLVTEAPLVGRAKVLDQVLARAAALRDGTLLEPVLVIAGAEGAGATRLLAAARNQAAVSGCLACFGASPRELAAEILAHPAVDGAPPAPDDSAEELLFRVDAALQRLPHDEWPVLILDDVHRLDDIEAAALREWVSALEGRAGRARVLFLLGGRNEGEGPGVGLLKTAGRAVPLELRDLAPLSGGDIRSALATMLGLNVGTPVVETLERATQGNPRLFAELLRLLADEDVLAFEGDELVLHQDRLERMRLPKGAVDVARRRAGRLSKKRKRLLQQLALLAEPLEYDGAVALGGDDVQALIETRFLVRDRGRVTFAHETARQASAVGDAAERQELLRGTASALEEAAPAASARLHVEAGEIDRGREVGLAPARELMTGGLFPAARGLLEVLCAGRPQGEVGRLYVQALYNTGRVEQAARLGEKLVEEAPDDMTTVMKVVSAMREAGRVEDALDLLARFEEAAEPTAAARLINARASMLSALGRHDEALAESRRAEQVQGALLDERGAIARIRANILRHCGRRGAALAVESALVEATADKPGAPARISALVNRAQLQRHAGRLLDAVRDCRKAIREAATRPVLLGRAWQVLGIALYDLGRPGRAARAWSRAGEIYERAARLRDVRNRLRDEAAALVLAGRPGEAESKLQRIASLAGEETDSDTPPPAALLHHLAGREAEALALCDAEPGARTALLRATIVSGSGEPDEAEAAWRSALRQAYGERRRDLVARVRVGLAECHARRGAWRLAEAFLDRGRTDLLALKTPLRARSLVVRAASAMSREEAAAAGRRIEEAVQISNRCNSPPLIAATYSAAASLLEEGAMQRFLRTPTNEAAASLLEVARDAWAIYGNETMLRKIDLHLSELPRLASDPLAGPDADRLVKVLHVVREMNQQFDRDRLLQVILDRAIELTGAERGFVILLQEGRQEVHIARNIDRESLSEPERKVSSRIIEEVISSGRIVRTEDAEIDDRFDEFVSVRQMHLKSIVAVPFRTRGKTIGALYLDNRFRTDNFSDQEERLLELFADQAVAAIEKAELVRELESKRAELEGLYRQQKVELKRQGAELRQARRENRQHRRARGHTFDKVIARSVAMQGVLREAKRYADSDLPVLLTGEPGTGKEILARAMHYASRRQSMPCLTVNCAGYSEGQLEAELFGHVRGSADGVDRDRSGLFEDADGGTLVLDEVGDMSQPMQVRLLRALEAGEVRRVGETAARTVDVRIVATTNTDLEQLIRLGKFREDLYYRLSGFVVRVPPLRERPDDIEPLSYAFVEEASRREGREDLAITSEAIAKLEAYSWPGNVRELRSVIMRAAVAAEEGSIEPDEVAFDARSQVSVLPGFDPTQADDVVQEVARRGVELNERQQAAIQRILQRGKLSFGEYQRIFRVSKSTTARDLEALLDLDVLEKRGKTRAVVYLPGPILREIASKLGRG
ncbi:MAG: sigma 54-interacting transcriptional regulator [Planctomycetota bacterium]